MGIAIRTAPLRSSGAPRRWANRLLFGALPVAVISTLVIFLMTFLATANPAAEKLGETATPADIAQLNQLWGLDQPFWQQYGTWLSHAVTGDLGSSYFTDVPVMESIGQRLPIDISITLIAVIVAVLFGFGFGILAAIHRGGRTDRTITAVSATLTTIPEFWLAIMFVVFFAVTLSWLPSGGWVPFTESPFQWLLHTILPGASLGLTVGATLARQVRNSLVATLDEDFVVGARVRGLSPRRVLFGHALRNASSPAVATLGLSVPALLGGAVIAESIFGLPGLGQFALNGAQSHDIPVIQGVLIVSIALVLVSNFMVDGLLGWLRPATKRV